MIFKGSSFMADSSTPVSWIIVSSEKTQFRISRPLRFFETAFGTFTFAGGNVKRFRFLFNQNFLRVIQSRWSRLFVIQTVGLFFYFFNSPYNCVYMKVT